MKSSLLRETFENIRNQKNNRFGLRVRLTLFVTLELLICIGIALAVDALFKSIFQGIHIPLWIELAGISILVGVLATSILSRSFFNPIKELRKAIEKVADGDFSVRIETKSTSKEMREICSGFNLMAHELSATEILQTSFVSNVSHEFKTPISAIEGYSMLLQDGENLTDEQCLYVDKIIFNTRRLSSLVGSILLLSKLENQTIMSKDTTYSLDEQIRHSILSLESAWEAKEIEFDVNLEPIRYTGQELLMHHVWDNLLSNAIKFSPQGGCISIALTVEASSILCTVSDNGPGLSEEAKKHVFDKFYQSDSSHKEDGTGLGLALVKKIVSLAKGTIIADTLPEGGAIFTVTLPIATIGDASQM